MGHHHHHHHHHQHGNGESLARIRLAFVLNFSFTIIELIGGFLTGSMAIVADAVHDLGDSFSLGLALVLEKKAQGQANQVWTYGYKRLSVLSALICGLVLTAGSCLVLYESIPKLFTPIEAPHSTGMIGLAILGMAVNGWAAFGLSRGGTQNEKILTLHLLEDLLGWVAVFIGAIVIYFTSWAFVDPLLAVLISCYILFNVYKNLLSTLKIFLMSIPEGIDLEEVAAALKRSDGLKEIHHYHAWSLDGEDHVFTCQVRLHENTTPNQVVEVKNSMRSTLRKHGFRHITIEVLEDEDAGCHPEGKS